MADVGLDPVQWLRNAEAELASDPTLDLTALARRTGTTEDQARTLLGARLVGLLLLPTAQRRTDLSPRASRRLLSALHAAAQATPRALTEATYSAFVTKSRENLPSSSEIVRTFGSWDNALVAAGIHNDSSATRRAGAWSEDAIARAVAQFVVEQMSHSHVLYQVWAKGRRWLPSMATIRRTHTWDAAREAAMRLLYEDDHWAERYAEAIRVEVDRRVIEFLVEGGRTTEET